MRQSISENKNDLNNQDWDSLLKQLSGPKMKKFLLNWLESFAEGKLLDGTTIESAITTLRALVAALEKSQITGYYTVQTYAELEALVTAENIQENVSYIVENDPTTSNNGYYSYVVGTGLILRERLVNGVIQSNNVDATSGGVIYDWSIEERKHLANAKWCQILRGASTGFVNFDWENDKIVFDAVYLNTFPQNKYLNITGSQEVTGISSYRYLLVNIETGTFLLSGLSNAFLYNSKEYYIVACFKPATQEVIECHSDCIQVNGDFIGASAISELRGNKADKTETILKTVERTNNLFDQSDIYSGGYIGDNETLVNSSPFGGTKAIEVSPGQTYGKYLNEEFNSWSNTKIRLFDDATGLLYSGADTSILVPSDAVNPRVYLSFYLDEATYTDLATAMFMDTELFDGFYYPFYLVSIDDEALAEYVSNLALVLEQTTGTSTTKAISQAGITLAIQQAINDLTVLNLLSNTGQSTTSGMTQKAITDALATLEAAIGGDPQYRFEAYPTGGYENFVVDVDVSISDNTTESTAVQDAPDLKQDRCILNLPTNYTRGGEPTKLIICGYGSGTAITSSTTKVGNVGLNVDYLLAQGYALLCCNATPGDEGGSINHAGVPQAYRSYLNAYKYITEKYNISRNGVALAGYSMGTLIMNQIENMGQIPVKCTITCGFDLELWKQQYSLKNATIRQYMTENFGFEGTVPTFTSNNPPTLAEQTYILNNVDKWAGYNPLTHGLSNKKITELYSVWLASSILPDGTGEADEAALYADLNLIRKSPLKVFISINDTSNSPRFVNYYTQMLKNAGVYSEVRVYPTSASPHTYSTKGDSILVTTLLDGDMIINGLTYEALLFIERWFN